MEQQVFTVKEILNITIKNMQMIMIPVEMSETVGKTVAISIRNLQACVDAIERDEAKQQAEQAALEDKGRANGCACCAPAADKPTAGEAWEEETDE